jgi:hypothetical protein
MGKRGDGWLKVATGLLIAAGVGSGVKFGLDMAARTAEVGWLVASFMFLVGSLIIWAGKKALVEQRAKQHAQRMLFALEQKCGAVLAAKGLRRDARSFVWRSADGLAFWPAVTGDDIGWRFEYVNRMGFLLPSMGLAVKVQASAPLRLQGTLSTFDTNPAKTITLDERLLDLAGEGAREARSLVERHVTRLAALGAQELDIQSKTPTRRGFLGVSFDGTGALDATIDAVRALCAGLDRGLDDDAGSAASHEDATSPSNP